jgi:valyl-tRNA synthetase
MHLEDYDNSLTPELEMMDRWFLSKLHYLIKTCTESFDNYEYSRVMADTELFFWQTFCDNYLEIVKDRLYNPDVRGEEARNSARFCLYYGLLSQLKMFAPIMPFITEELYGMYYAKKEGLKSIHNSKWPEWKESLFDKEADSVGDTLVEILAIVRKFKSDNNIALNVPVKKLTVISDVKKLDKAFDDLKAVTKAEDIELKKGEFKVEVIK